MTGHRPLTQEDNKAATIMTSDMRTNESGVTRSLTEQHARSADLSDENRFEIVLTAARLLHENGEETHGTLVAVDQLAKSLGCGLSILPTWDQLVLQVDGDRTRAIAAVPSNVNMARVMATLKVVQDIGDGSLQGCDAMAALQAAGRAPQSNLWLFAFACTVGAAALSIINGSSHLLPLCIIMLGALAGAFLRRGLALVPMNSFFQMFAASLLAGLLGSIGIHYNLSTPMRLVALGPLFVLVPGPALLNGAFDIAAFRLPLGIARVTFGLITILLLSAGVVIGLTVGGTTLPPMPPSREVALWIDTICAGIAAVSYGIFFSMPRRMLIYPWLMSMVAHATHWGLISGLGMSNAAGAGIACLGVGIILVPIARRLKLPFAAVGFASVVSMVPGIFLFRMGGGLVAIQQAGLKAPADLIIGVLSDGTTAVMTVTAMALGLLLPMRMYAYFDSRRKTRKAPDSTSSF